MSTERKDLLAICEHLGACDGPQEATSKTDIELLRSIVSKLKQLDSAAAAGSRPTAAGQARARNQDKPCGDELKVLLNLNSLPDSLGFPAQFRQNKKLAEASNNWDALRKFNDLLKQDHTCRRQMLLNRLDCTIESFKWKASENSTVTGGSSGKKTSLNDLIHEKYNQARNNLREEPQVSLSHLLAVRETECDKLLNCIVSTRKVDCQVSYKHRQKQQQSQESNKLVNLKQIIIPDVPDRGGRPGEVRAPSKESFYQQNRGRGGRGRR